MGKYVFLFLIAAVQLMAIEVLTEGKVGYYLPVDAKFRSTYGEDGIIGGIESSFSTKYNNIYPWLSVSMYRNSHHPDNMGGRKTSIYTIPVGVGLKYMYFFGRLGVYGGAGVLPTYAHIHNYSPLAVEKQAKWGCGGIAKVGLLAYQLGNVFIDLFGEYSYVKMNFHNRGNLLEVNPLNLGNFTVGGAVGYHFGRSSCSCDDDD